MWSARSSSTTIRTACPHHDRIDAVQLHRPGLLVGAEPDHLPGLRIPPDQRPGGDHLADVEPGAELPAQRPERRLVMPAIGASTTGGQTGYWPIARTSPAGVGCGRCAVASVSAARLAGAVTVTPSSVPGRPAGDMPRCAIRIDRILPANRAVDRPDLLAAPVRLALPEGSVALVAPIDPELADTAAFCAAYEVPLCGLGELCGGHRQAGRGAAVGRRRGAGHHPGRRERCGPPPDGCPEGFVRGDGRRRRRSPAWSTAGSPRSACRRAGRSWSTLRCAAAGPVVIGSGIRGSKIVIDGAALAAGCPALRPDRSPFAARLICRAPG